MLRRQRVIPTLLALTSAALVAIAVETGRFWILANGAVSIGPSRGTNCFAGGCMPTNLDWVGGSDLWMRCGMATFAGGLIAALALVIFAGGQAAGRPGTWTSRLVLVSLLTLLVPTIGFIATMPDLPSISLGRGLPLLFSGIAIGLATSFWVGRRART